MRKIKLKRFVLPLFVLLLLVPDGIAAEGSLNKIEEIKIELSDEERDYIEQLGEVPVLFSKSKGPFQYYNEAEKELKGITVDIFRELEKITGIRFRYMLSENMEDGVGIMDRKEALMLAAIPNDTALAEAYNAVLSTPYISAPISAVMKQNSTSMDTENRILALTEGLYIDSAFADVKEIIRCETIEECIYAVANGKADFTYGNSYVMEFYARKSGKSDVILVPLDERKQELCIAVHEDLDSRLVSVLNKAIDVFPDDIKQNIIMNNASHYIQNMTFSRLIAANPIASMLVFLSSIMLVFIISVFILQNYKKKNSQIDIANQRYQLIADISNEYFYEYDYDTDCFSMSARMAEVFGIKREYKKWISEFEQQHFFTIHEEEGVIADIYKKDRERRSQDKVSQTFDVQIPMPDGIKRWFRILRIVLYKNGEPVYAVGKVSDIQKEVEEKAMLIEKSRRDSLTKLYNAATSKEMISYYLDTEKNVYGSLFIIDVDNFKEVNDNCGHYTGDKVLKEVAGILTSFFRAEDIIGRLGGDEFILLVKNLCNREQIAHKCRQLQEKVNNISVGNDKKVTISIGIGIIKEKTAFEQLYQQADKALYIAKEEGRADFRIYER